MTEPNAFTKEAVSAPLPDDAPSALQAKAFRAFQLGEVDNTSEEAVKVGLPHPDTQSAPKSQEDETPTTEFVFTDDTEALPKGASGAKIADGVFEIVKGTAAAEPDAKSVPKASPKAVASFDAHGTHPVRLEDNSHTNQS